MPILTQRTILLAKVETTPGVDAVPVPSLDAVQTTEPQYSVAGNNLERKFTKPDFGNYPSIIGRKLATVKFSVELTGSGVPDLSPTWARLLEGCSMLRSTQTGVSRTLVAAPTGAARVANTTTFTTGTAHGFVAGQSITLSGVPDATFNGTFVVLTTPNTTTFTVSNPGTNATSGTGAAILNTGELFTPTTLNQRTLTLYVYMDGLLTRMTGCMGTFSINAKAGEFGTLEFTFTGNYLRPAPAAFPTDMVYTLANPPLIEWGTMTLYGDATLVAEALKLDMGNNVVPRADLNSSNGYRGVRIASRNPTGGLDPEMETSHAFWARYEASTLGTLLMRVGTNAGVNVGGQTIEITAPGTQITGTAYGDRDGLRTYDLSLAFRRVAANGNDDFTILFD